VPGASDALRPIEIQADPVATADAKNLPAS